MKRYLKLIVLLVFTLSIVFTLASSTSATELKTGIGIVEARGGLRLREKPSTSADIITVAQKGDMVVVIAGAWEDTTGVITAVNAQKQTVTINVELFGRETPVEINFAEVKKK